MLSFTSKQEAAIRAAGQKNGMKISRRLFSLLVEKTRETLKKHPELEFWEAQRHALNEHNIWNKQRKAYNSALGAYFGQIGGYRAARRSRAGAPKRGKREGMIPSELERSGQYRLMI